jgi:hypothetical protein
MPLSERPCSDVFTAEHIMRKQHPMPGAISAASHTLRASYRHTRKTPSPRVPALMMELSANLLDRRVTSGAPTAAPTPSMLISSP